MEDWMAHFKRMYRFDQWKCEAENRTEGRNGGTFALYLERNGTYERLKQQVMPAIWGKALYMLREIIRKEDQVFEVCLYPYRSVQDAKEGMLQHLIAQVSYEEVKEGRVGDVCFTHPDVRGRYMLLLNRQTMIEIRACGTEACMEDIRLLATLIVEQMKS